MPPGVFESLWKPVGNFPDGPPPPSYVKYDATSGVEERFELYTGPNPSKGNAWTNFQHYKRWVGSFNGVYRLPYTTAWPNTGNRHWVADLPPWYGWDQHRGVGAIIALPLYTLSTGVDLVENPSNLSSLLSRGSTAILPKIKSEMSLVNSVIELKDFGSMVKTVGLRLREIQSIMRHLPRKDWASQTFANMYYDWKSYVKKVKSSFKPGGDRSYLARQASSAFLQWKFAIAPLISDVWAIKSALRALEKQINDLITNEGRVKVRHWTYRWRDDPGKTRTSHYYMGVPAFPPVSASTDIESGDLGMDSEFHMQLKYNYNFTAYQREHARILSLLDALGVNFNPAIIWNAMRYTFIVDWVIGVSRFLEQFKVANMEPKINILGGLWSIKRRKSYWWNKIHYAPDGVTCTRKLSGPVITEEAYKRQAFVPGLSWLVASGLSSMEFTLGAALVTARRRKARK